MLELYEKIFDFEDFCKNIYSKYFNVEVDFTQIQANKDVLIINKDKISVEDINNYLEFYKYMPEGNTKMSIINNFDQIDKKLQNKLLKTYEQSKYLHVIIINNRHKVLPTIISRANIKSYKNKTQNIDNYPKRYQEKLKKINFNVDCNKDLIDKYIKVFDILEKEDYLGLYTYLTLEFLDLDVQIIYEIIQSQSQNIEIDKMLDIQERLFLGGNKKMQLESFLLEAYKNTVKQN